MINILKKGDVKLMISDTEYLKINNKCIEDNVCEQCTWADIDYVDEENNINIKFGSNTLQSICNYMIERDEFKKLINGENIMDASILDIGLEHNQCYSKGYPIECFSLYHFEGNSHKQIQPYYNSWLYNDKEGNIIFEITPFYPWHNVNKRTHPERIPFKEWIKGYKPTLKTIIPKKNLLKWVEQAKNLRKEIGLDF